LSQKSTFIQGFLACSNGCVNHKWTCKTLLSLTTSSSRYLYLVIVVIKQDLIFMVVNMSKKERKMRSKVSEKDTWKIKLYWSVKYINILLNVETISKRNYFKKLKKTNKRKILPGNNLIFILRIRFETLLNKINIQFKYFFVLIYCSSFEKCVWWWLDKLYTSNSFAFARLLLGMTDLHQPQTLLKTFYSINFFFEEQKKTKQDKLSSAYGPRMR
jgi:hypothetical protein